MECHGLQCGYCTPGMVMASVSLLDEVPNPTEAEVREGSRGQPLPMHGLPQHREGRAERSRRYEVIPVAFDYERAGSADEALALLAEHGDEAKLLAGGHSLLPVMKLRLAYPSILVDIGRLSELSYVRRRRRSPRHRCSHPSPRPRDQPARPGARAAAGARHQPRRRSPGPPSWHLRRFACARRCVRRSPVDSAGARRLGRRSQRRWRRASDRGQPTCSPASSSRTSSRPRCSPRSASPSTPVPDGASRSSTAGLRTGRSWASSAQQLTAEPRWLSSTCTPHRSEPPPSKQALAGGASAAEAADLAAEGVEPSIRPERQRRVPPAPRTGPHASGTHRSRHRLRIRPHPNPTAVPGGSGPGSSIGPGR